MRADRYSSPGNNQNPLIFLGLDALCKGRAFFQLPGAQQRGSACCSLSRLLLLRLHTPLTLYLLNVYKQLKFHSEPAVLLKPSRATSKTLNGH